MTAPPVLSILILTRNEAENLEVLIPDVRSELAGSGFDLEVIVVDAWSADGTPDVARRHGATVLEQSRPGYANALREGLAACTGVSIVTIDADLSHRPSFLGDMLAASRESDLVIASRYVAGGRADMPSTRRILSRILNTVFRVAVGLDVCDASSGYRLYDRRSIDAIDPRGSHFDVLPEIVTQIVASGLRVAEIPFHYHPRESGVSKARVLRFLPSYVRTLVRCVHDRARTAGRMRTVDAK